MQNCETGRLTPCGDLEKLRANIRRLIEDRNLRILLGENAHRFVEENYSWDKLIDHWISSCIPQLAMKEPREG